MPAFQCFSTRGCLCNQKFYLPKEAQRVRARDQHELIYERKFIRNLDSLLYHEPSSGNRPGYDPPMNLDFDGVCSVHNVGYLTMCCGMMGLSAEAYKCLLS